MNQWVSFPHPNPDSRVRLFCFPYSGAGASIFFSWPKIFLPLHQVELGLIQYPGRENRLSEPCITSLSSLVEAAKENICDYLDKPFAFYGHSLGALVSFELARSLRENFNLIPFHLFLSSHPAPQIEQHEIPIHNLPENEFSEKIKSLSGMQKEVLESAELMQILLPILRADFEICEKYIYEPQPPLNCPISVFGGFQDLNSPPEQLKAWEKQTTSTFSLRMFPGNHFFLNESRLLLIETIARELMNDISVIA